MHKLFQGLSVSGIVRPGHIYLFCDNLERGWHPEAVDFLYTIRSDDEVLPALDMELKILSDIYELKKYFGFTKISDDCYQFSMLCYERELGSKNRFSLYLQRIVSFEEKLRRELEIGL